MSRQVTTPEQGRRIAGVAHGENEAPMFLGAITRPEPWQLDGLDGGQIEDIEPKGSFFGRHGLFIGIFVVPVLLATLYFGFIAAGQFVTETKFIVRTAGAGGDASLSSILHSSGMSRAVDETYAVSTYIQSRDAVSRLEKTANLREILGRPEGDFIFRFPNFYTKDNAEQLFHAYKRFIAVDVDSSTGITSLQTKAFRAEDAVFLSRKIVESADEFINRLNERAHEDAVRYAQGLIKEANERLAGVEQRLATFRNKEMVLDPAKESTSTLEVLARLSTEVIKLEANLARLVLQTPNSPAIPTLREQIRSLRAEYDKQRNAIAGDRNSMASKLEGFERISLERELAAKAMGLALLELEKARQSQQSDRIYLQTIVSPNLADLPSRPYRILSILVVAVLCGMVFWTIKSLREITLEHQA